MDLQLPEKINLHKMAEMLGDRAEFEPELYMGMKVQWSDTLKLILFSTGKIMICPMVVERNRAALENTPVAYLCHHSGIHSVVGIFRGTINCNFFKPGRCCNDGIISSSKNYFQYVFESVCKKRTFWLAQQNF